MQQQNKLVRLIKEQPLFVLAWVAGIAAILLLFWAGARTGRDIGDGDIPEPTAGTFITYKDRTFNPFGIVRVDNFIRDDMTYFARQALPDYGPDSKPAVIFEVKEFEPAQNGKVSFKGTYKDVKGEVTVTAERLPYDLAKVSISWNGNNLDNQLPSASNRNQFIAKLPVEQDGYQISYSPDADIFTITPTVAGDKPISDATAFIKKSLGEDFSADDITYEYPAYLKGEPQHNTSNSYNASDEDPGHDH